MSADGSFGRYPGQNACRWFISSCEAEGYVMDPRKKTNLDFITTVAAILHLVMKTVTRKLT